MATANKSARYDLHAHAETGTGSSGEARKDSSGVDVVGTLNLIARKQGSHGASLLYFGGCLVLSGLVALVCYAPSLCPLAFLGFVATCLPYRAYTFTKRKWVFFLVDYCYFANLAVAVFLVWAPAHAGWEAAVYAACEGPLAGALVAWQCAWVMGSPDHIITVLMHSLPGLALFCHRHLSHTRQPLQLAAALAEALTGGAAAAAKATATAAEPAAPGATATATAAGLGLLQRLAAAAGLARGQVPCGADVVGSWAGAAAAEVCAAASGAAGTYAAAAASSAAVGTGSLGAAATAAAAGDGSCGSGIAAAAAAAAGAAPPSALCYAAPLPPMSCPSPTWVWLVAAPLVFYLTWQLVYFVIVQVCFRRPILARGYDTSYRSLARRAQRSGSILNRLVRSGGVARRLFMYGLLQFLFTLATLALAVATYHSFEAAVTWQLVKFLLPLYLGAVHTCERAPVQELRVAAARMAAAGLLAAPAAKALRAAAAQKQKVVESKVQDKVREGLGK